MRIGARHEEKDLPMRKDIQAKMANRAEGVEKERKTGGLGRA